MKINIKLLILVLVSFLTFLSCTRDEVINKNGEISKELTKDPLFESMDKAYSKYLEDMIKYPRDNVNQISDKKFKKDLELNKFKSFNDYAKAKEKAGYVDFGKRIRNLIAFKAAEEKLFQKYPELKVNKKKFYSFFIKTRRSQIGDERMKQLLLGRKEIQLKKI
ncbi:hypothetical protein D0809_19175 [Flavobacterium circumlabens]|uniref:Lipoprotein n=1 Tax=Flavobacterium circumlabens TaxID=2133765 RepID=A0A4Y7U9J4_9FLAO|nr:hypothetical protein [Flavobacterium circumlabens]TCN53925.1 hypothetical protein EV142_108232 [Flavobacterium circumlabens]TEB42489.1 hypothetical protein D0809_19175 [Flavobacterium circumlabens]